MFFILFHLVVNSYIAFSSSCEETCNVSRPTQTVFTRQGGASFGYATSCCAATLGNCAFSNEEGQCTSMQYYTIPDDGGTHCPLDGLGDACPICQEMYNQSKFLSMTFCPLSENCCTFVPMLLERAKMRNIHQIWD